LPASSVADGAATTILLVLSNTIRVFVYWALGCPRAISPQTLQRFCGRQRGVRGNPSRHRLADWLGLQRLPKPRRAWSAISHLAARIMLPGCRLHLQRAGGGKRPPAGSAQCRSQHRRVLARVGRHQAALFLPSKPQPRCCSISRLIPGYGVRCVWP